MSENSCGKRASALAKEEPAFTSAGSAAIRCAAARSRLRRPGRSAPAPACVPSSPDPRSAGSMIASPVAPNTARRKDRPDAPPAVPPSPPGARPAHQRTAAQQAARSPRRVGLDHALARGAPWPSSASNAYAGMLRMIRAQPGRGVRARGGGLHAARRRCVSLLAERQGEDAWPASKQSNPTASTPATCDEAAADRLRAGPRTTAAALFQPAALKATAAAGLALVRRCRPDSAWRRRSP